MSELIGVDENNKYVVQLQHKDTETNIYQIKDIKAQNDIAALTARLSQINIENGTAGEWNQLLSNAQTEQSGIYIITGYNDAPLADELLEEEENIIYPAILIANCADNKYCLIGADGEIFLREGQTSDDYKWEHCTLRVDFNNLKNNYEAHLNGESKEGSLKTHSELETQINNLQTEINALKNDLASIKSLYLKGIDQMDTTNPLEELRLLILADNTQYTDEHSADSSTIIQQDILQAISTGIGLNAAKGRIVYKVNENFDELLDFLYKSATFGSNNTITDITMDYSDSSAFFNDFIFYPEKPADTEDHSLNNFDVIVLMVNINGITGTTSATSIGNLVKNVTTVYQDNVLTISPNTLTAKLQHTIDIIQKAAPDAQLWLMAPPTIYTNETTASDPNYEEIAALAIARAEAAGREKQLQFYQSRTGINKNTINTNLTLLPSTGSDSKQYAIKSKTVTTQVASNLVSSLQASRGSINTIIRLEN